MSHIKVPFTPEQVEALNRWQNTPWVHPFTCGNDRGDDAHVAYQIEHGGDLGQLVATPEGWKCPVCGYSQDWAHDFMTRHPPRLGDPRLNPSQHFDS